MEWEFYHPVYMCIVTVSPVKSCGVLGPLLRAIHFFNNQNKKMSVSLAHVKTRFQWLFDSAKVLPFLRSYYFFSHGQALKAQPW